jgi:hypothetical protein
MKILTALALLLGLASPALTIEVHCTTTQNTILNRLETLCNDGTRATPYWNEALQRWDTIISENPRKTCAAVSPHEAGKGALSMREVIRGCPLKLSRPSLTSSLTL